MSNDTVVSLAAPAPVPDPLTELLRSGARRLVEAAVRAEFEEHLSAFGHEKLPDGRQRVVRNGRLPERKILTGLGEVDVRVPKARSRAPAGPVVPARPRGATIGPAGDPAACPVGPWRVAPIPPPLVTPRGLRRKENSYVQETNFGNARSLLRRFR